LKLCLELLVEFRREIETTSLKEMQEFPPILARIYGSGTPHLRTTLYDYYWDCLNIAHLAEEETASGEYASPEKVEQRFLVAIDAEVSRLREYQQDQELVESERRKVEILRQSAPDSRGLDRLVRYENSLDRAFDRTLSQLERFQRIRKGQPVPPTIKVDISG
jgi:hypothetical protein